MLTVEKYLSAPHDIPAAQIALAPRLTLPFSERSKSRLRAALDDGREVAVFLPRGTVLRGGDLLVLDDGSYIEVRAAPESVLQVTASDAHALMRAAYHLGNRHTPAEIDPTSLRLEYDSVLAEMLARLGVTVTRADLPFEPEAGAYGGGHRHGHDATFAEDHAAAQALFEQHHGHSHDHVYTRHHPHHAHDDPNGERGP
ncbi:MAG: urease accessory protein UreE [Aromatoleum sp.]|jgi:urease accessory protein|uniref:urease accessory protein UreE n=1 Tax=Aromatoleum sp. TaxID=2307007 RepID=UPI002894AF76|nr:urease accessory protein UreE [Aromatoleum sp.]MDT3669436.1 urease accessory protein UreE [Aromatoleum sp.]